MKKIEEILNGEVFDWYPNRYPFRSYINSVMNFVDMNGVISVAGLFSPRLIEYKNHVFLAKNVGNMLEKNTLFPCPCGNGDRKTTERYYNLFNLEEFFIETADETSDDLRMVKKFGNLLLYFWGIKLRESFPKRRFKFEIAEDLYDEHGFCITFWQE